VKPTNQPRTARLEAHDPTAPTSGNGYFQEKASKKPRQIDKFHDKSTGRFYTFVYGGGKSFGGNKKSRPDCSGRLLG